MWFPVVVGGFAVDGCMGGHRSSDSELETAIQVSDTDPHLPLLGHSAVHTCGPQSGQRPEQTALLGDLDRELPGRSEAEEQRTLGFRRGVMAGLLMNGKGWKESEGSDLDGMEFDQIDAFK